MNKRNRVILRDIEPDDFVLALRAVKFLMGQFRQDAILSYENGKKFYVRRNKASITVRPCEATQQREAKP